MPQILLFDYNTEDAFEQEFYHPNHGLMKWLLIYNDYTEYTDKIYAIYFDEDNNHQQITSKKLNSCMNPQSFKTLLCCIQTISDRKVYVKALISLLQHESDQSTHKNNVSTQSNIGYIKNTVSLNKRKHSISDSESDSEKVLVVESGSAENQVAQDTPNANLTDNHGEDKIVVVKIRNFENQISKDTNTTHGSIKLVKIRNFQNDIPNGDIIESSKVSNLENQISKVIPNGDLTESLGKQISQTTPNSNVKETQENIQTPKPITDTKTTDRVGNIQVANINNLRNPITELKSEPEESLQMPMYTQENTDKNITSGNNDLENKEYKAALDDIIKPISSISIVLFDGTKLKLKVRPKDVFHLTEPKILQHLSKAEKNKLILHQAFIDWKHCLKTNSDGYMPIHLAVLHNDIELLKRQIAILKARNVSINIRAHGMTPLHMAIKKNRLRCTNMLLHKGACPLLFTKDHRNALHLAAMSRADIFESVFDAVIRTIAVKALCKKAYDKSRKDILGITDVHGYTAFMLACKLGNLSNMSTMYQHCTSIVNNQMPTTGNTALHIVFTEFLAFCETNKIPGPKQKMELIVVCNLLSFGASASLRNYSGVSFKDLLNKSKSFKLHFFLNHLANSRKMVNDDFEKFWKRFIQGDEEDIKNKSWMELYKKAMLENVGSTNKPVPWNEYRKTLDDRLALDNIEDYIKSNKRQLFVSEKTHVKTSKKKKPNRRNISTITSLNFEHNYNITSSNLEPEANFISRDNTGSNGPSKTTLPQDVAKNYSIKESGNIDSELKTKTKMKEMKLANVDTNKALIEDKEKRSDNNSLKISPVPIVDVKPTIVKNVDKNINLEKNARLTNPIRIRGTPVAMRNVLSVKKET